MGGDRGTSSAPPDWRIRRARPADAAAIATLKLDHGWVQQKYAQEQRAGINVQSVAGELGPRAGYSLVAVAGGRIVAAGIGLYAWGKLRIDDVVVHPDVRGRGIAAELVRRLIAHARKRNLISAYLEVGSTNQAAIQAYLKAGLVVKAAYGIPVNGGYLVAMHYPIRPEEKDAP